jgi:hypothetical protein
MPDAVALTPDLARDLIAMRAAWKSGTLDPSRVQQRPMRRRDGPQRWLPVKNHEVMLEIPAFACVEVVDIIDEGNDDTDVPNVPITVRRPADGGSGIFLFVGNEPIEKNGGFGIATIDLPTWVLFDDSGGDLSANGETVGPADESFEVQEGPGLLAMQWAAIATVTDLNGNERAYVVRDDGPVQLLGKLDGALSFEGSQTVDIWEYDGADFAATGATVTAYDWLLLTGESLADETKVVIKRLPDGRWYITNAACGV